MTTKKRTIIIVFRGVGAHKGDENQVSRHDETRQTTVIIIDFYFFHHHNGALLVGLYASLQHRFGRVIKKKEKNVIRLHGEKQTRSNCSSSRYEHSGKCHYIRPDGRDVRNLF